MYIRFFSFFAILILVLAGCAGTSTNKELGTLQAKEEETNDLPTDGPQGAVEVDVTNILGVQLPARVEFVLKEGKGKRTVEFHEGRGEVMLPVGAYQAYVYIYEDGISIMVETVSIEVTEQKTAFVLVNLMEGTSGSLRTLDFDFDGDLAIDRVELAQGTDAKDPADVPGATPVPFASPVLSQENGWYRGDLYARSSYGDGKESVADLVRRAEKEGLDFLAIADLNTIKSVEDPAFHSKKLVLIPSMLWGNQERGLALIYGPRTIPGAPGVVASAQEECLRVQAQGGVFAIAHPCLQTTPWLWGIGYVNAIQVWYRDWRQLPPLRLAQLDENLKTREKGKLVQSIAAAAACAELEPVSANTQASMYWDFELVRGLRACALAGSGSGSPKVPLGKPLTYVWAKEKSLTAILEGIRLGRTYLSSGEDGPQLSFTADVLGDGTIDVSMGGIAPLHVDIVFEIGVRNAKGKKLELLLDGRPVLTKVIESDTFVQRIPQHPKTYGAYRARVISAAPPESPGFGYLEMHALSSPIYVQDITQELLWRRNPNLDVSKTWVRVKSAPGPEEVYLPESSPQTIGGRPISNVTP